MAWGDCKDDADTLFWRGNIIVTKATFQNLVIWSSPSSDTHTLFWSKFGNNQLQIPILLTNT